MRRSPDPMQKAPWFSLTYQIIGLAMQVHNELGPGHREEVYHNAMVAKLTNAGMSFVDELFQAVTLEDGTVVGQNKPDLVIDDTVIVELKARTHGMTVDDQAQVIGYFAAFAQCPVGLWINFGRARLEYHRLLPPKSVRAFQRRKWDGARSG